ncbi:hypothetical protein BCR44DRAFT_1200745 [Catenaria anguillulae PL171]|uniref:Uncharacterized protein n=1 Tax=Catenaria anguillulae PL171 TaxID=765915 RepID=A0A1Y2H2Z1_9FUNG|nr:hypothetical protein BCR44DRAFT_1200745 [Catenaria anguillulae PL171]
MPQDDLARALASSPSPVMSPQDPIASPKPSPTISLSFFWSDPEDDGEDGDAEPAIDLRSPTGPHFDDGAHNLDGAHSIDGPIHAGGGARNLGRGRDGDGPFHAGGDYDSALQGGEMDVADQTHDIANAFNDGIDPDQEDGGIPNMASGSALSHQDDYDGEQADPDAQEEVDGEDQDDASVFGDQYLVHEFELTDAMFDYMDDADVEATLATPGSVEWVVDSDEEHGDSDDEAEPVASVDELFGVDSESFNPKVFHAGPDGFQVTAKIFANGLVIHPTTPDYPHSSDLNESTTKSRRGGIVNLVMAGAHDLTTEAVTSNIQYSLGSPMGDDKQFRVVKLFASIAHLIPGIEDMIVPAFRRHSRTCKGVKCCTYADTRISEMEHYGGYPDYTAEPYASIRASVEAAMRNSVYQITMTFYNSKVVDWLCACGHPGKLVHNANAPEHMSKWFVGCSAYNRLDPPGSHKGFGIRTAELDMGLLCDLMGYKGPHRPETSTTKPDVRCRTVVSNGRTSECPVGHVKSDGSVDRASVVSQNRDCTVKCDIYLPEDPEFRFYFIHMTGKHNHPPPPPLKTPRHLKVRINEGVKLRDAPNAFDHLTSLERLALVATIHKIDVAHPSLVQLDRVGEVTSRRTGPGIMASDEVAVFQAFASGSSTIRDFIRSVAIVDGQFLGFAMLDEGAHALSKSRVIDIDMTYRCIRGDINQVKVVAWDPIACRLIVVARAWVRGQDAQMYYTIVNTLDSAFNKIIGRRLQFSAIRRVREEIGAPIADLDLDVVELDAIRVDMDAGQAKGIGTWLREREPLLGDTWQEVVPHVLVLCHVHAARNIQQTGFSPDAKRKMTKLLEATSPGEWDTVLRQLRRMHEESPAATVPANKSLKDWVDKYAQPWVGGPWRLGCPRFPHHFCKVFAATPTTSRGRMAATTESSARVWVSLIMLSVHARWTSTTSAATALRATWA